MKKWIYVVSASLILSACVSPAPKLNVYDSQAVASHIKVERDNFKKLTAYKGPNASGDNADSVFIRAWKYDKNSEIAYQIYVSDYYGGEWRFYNTAHDSNGKKLETTLISRDVDSCSRYGCLHTEHIGISVTRGYLESNQESGINFKLSGKGGEEVFYIPGGYIKAILSVVN